MYYIIATCKLLSKKLQSCEYVQHNYNIDTAADILY